MTIKNTCIAFKVQYFIFNLDLFPKTTDNTQEANIFRILKYSLALRKLIKIIL